MHRDNDSSADSSARETWRRLTISGLGVVCALVLSGCGESAKRGFLPHAVTEQSERIINLWNGSWIAALGVGALVWGLMFWCMVAYRRKKSDVGLPEQLRYNVPIEILYTVVPLLMVASLAYYTIRDEQVLLDTSNKPEVTVNVVGKQWTWDFNYIEAETFQAGAQVLLTGQPGIRDELPVLYLPVNKRVEFVLTARDVIHSFWVPQFLMKLDILPGKVNRFQVKPTELGTFQGRCAELCGAYHSTMLLQVKVVSQADFDAQMEKLKASGNRGILDNSLSREEIQQSDQRFLPEQGVK